jgi:hypothetical protein
MAELVPSKVLVGGSRNAASQSGAVMVEYVFGLIVFLPLLFGLLGLAIVMENWSALEYDVRVAIRQAYPLRDIDPAAYTAGIEAFILDKAKQRGFDIPANNVRICPVPRIPDPRPPQRPAVCSFNSVGELGGSFYVLVAYEASWLGLDVIPKLPLVVESFHIA